MIGNICELAGMEIKAVTLALVLLLLARAVGCAHNSPDSPNGGGDEGSLDTLTLKKKA